MENPKSVRRNEALLERLARADNVSHDGKQWLQCALDPAHDVDLVVAGYPDRSNIPSVVQRVVQTMVIAAPNPSMTNNWDCSLIDWPDIVNGEMSDYNTTTGAPPGSVYMVSSASSTGGLVAYSTDSGQHTLPPSGTNNNTQFLDAYDYVSNTSSRVIGKAFEVMNTTAELYRQGTVITWRQAEGCELAPQGVLFVGSGGSQTNPTYVGKTPVVCSPEPPTEATVAQLLPGSQQWEAAKGVYMPSYLQGMVNPPTRMVPELQLYGAGIPGSTPYSGVGKSCYQVATWGTFDTTEIMPYSSFTTPYSICGAYFLGLSPQTTLTVRQILWIETFPGVRDTLAPLSHPSAAYDPFALALYAEAARKLPIATVFGDNPIGEWFEDVVDTIAQVASPALGVASAVFPEAAPFLLPAAGAAELARGVIKSRRKTRKAKRTAKAQRQAPSGRPK